MTPRVRKVALTAHVTSSVGWLGAVAAFLVLSIAGLTSHDPEVVRGAYLAMNAVSQWLIVPLSLAALLTGLIQSFGTPWGLFRHYWVLVKFVLSLGATFLLLLHQFTAVATAARRVSATPPGTWPNVGTIGIQLVADASLGIAVLLVVTTLSIFKPWGRTRYGQRRNVEGFDIEGSAPSAGLPLGLKIFLVVTGLVVLGVVLAKHLAGGGLGHHFH
jgi:hypothetical protein